MRFNTQIADAETRRRAASEIYRTGAARFILVQGLFKWALPMFIFFALYDYFVVGNHDASHTILLAVTCGFGGLLLATFKWIGVRRSARQNS